MNSSPSHSDGRRQSNLSLALWAAADKSLPMIYGAAIVVILPQTLSDIELGSWAIFQGIFMAISLLADFFILQPMVKISSEHESDSQPIITASNVLYAAFTLGLSFLVVLFARPIAELFKTPVAAAAFALMGLTMLSTIVRNVSIRILQIDYRIVAIFVIDLVYFTIVIGLSIIGWRDGTLREAGDFVMYNLWGFLASSAVGFIYTMRRMVPSLGGLESAFRRVLRLGVHQGGTGFLTVTQQQTDIAIVSGLRGGVAVGIYYVARSFFRVFEAIRDAAQLLLVPATSKAFSQERIESVAEISEVSTAALFLLLVPVAIACVVGAPIVGPMLPQKYAEAVPEFQLLMSCGVAMPFVIVPSAILLGIGHTRDLFRGTLVGTAALVSLGVLFTWFWGAVGMAAAVLAGTVVTGALLTERMNRYVPFTFRGVVRRSRSLVPIVRRRLLGVAGNAAGAPARLGIRRGSPPEQHRN